MHARCGAKYFGSDGLASKLERTSPELSSADLDELRAALEGGARLDGAPASAPSSVRRLGQMKGGSRALESVDARGHDAQVDARPALERIASALAQAGLEAVLVGNAGAALHGAPVTTLDFDFMFRETPLNLTKLKRFAKLLGAVVFRPYYPVSKLYRVVNDDTGLQIDFMPVLHGVRSFASLRSRAEPLKLGSTELQVAALEDIIKSKAAAARPRDLAVLPVLETTLREKSRPKSKRR